MHFLFSHRNSFLSWLQLLGLAVGDSAGAGVAAVMLHVHGHPPLECKRCRKGQGHRRPLLAMRQSECQPLGYTPGSATHCPADAGHAAVPVGSPTHRSPSHPCCLHSCRCRRTVDRSTDIPGRSCSGTVCWGDTGISLHRQTETNGDGERRRHSRAVTLVTSCCSASASGEALSHEGERAPETKAKRLKQRQSPSSWPSPAPHSQPQHLQLEPSLGTKGTRGSGTVTPQTAAPAAHARERGEALQHHSQHSSGFSSELSPQSSSPSHFQARGLHSVLLHWNSSRGHVRTATATGQEETCEMLLPGYQNPSLALQFTLQFTAQLQFTA